MTIKHAKANARRLRWHEISTNTRVLLDGKLRGLYEHAADERAFDALNVDKQQSLLVFARRLVELNLWDSIRRIENVYGVGGVGISFTAWPFLESALRRRTDFTAMFAAHKDASAGFLERGRTQSPRFIFFAPQGNRNRAVFGARISISTARSLFRSVCGDTYCAKSCEGKHPIGVASNML